MNETERKAYLEQFNRRTHVLGRIVSAITLVLVVGAPFLIGTFLGAAWRSFSSTRPCSAPAAATSPSSPATSSI